MDDAIQQVEVEKHVSVPATWTLDLIRVLIQPSILVVAACLCLHAEENALLEAGRERIGEDSVIYCNTSVCFCLLLDARLSQADILLARAFRCPCLTCSVKIVQCGVREVVYNLSYAMEEASARILEEGGVKLRKMEVRREIV